MKKYISIILTMLLANIFGCENSLAGNIILAGATLAPKSSVTIMTPDLEYPRASYNINCNIINSSFVESDQVVISINLGGTVNGQNSSTHQFSINQQMNKYELKGVSAHKGSKKLAVSFQNYDDRITLYISDCVATFAVQ